MHEDIGKTPEEYIKEIKQLATDFSEILEVTLEEAFKILGYDTNSHLSEEVIENIEYFKSLLQALNTVEIGGKLAKYYLDKPMKNLDISFKEKYTPLTKKAILLKGNMDDIKAAFLSLLSLDDGSFS